MPFKTKEAKQQWFSEYYLENRDRLNKRDTEYRHALKQSCLNRYGLVCICCQEDTFEKLSIDRIDGTSHRPLSSKEFYRWLQQHNFPDGYQTMCKRCNQSKLKGTKCRLDHTKDLKAILKDIVDLDRIFA